MKAINILLLSRRICEPRHHRCDEGEDQSKAYHRLRRVGLEQGEWLLEGRSVRNALQDRFGGLAKEGGGGGVGGNRRGGFREG